MSKYIKRKYKFIYFYRIINNINNHFYYGIHATNNLNDDYMGSGVRLILKYFDTLKEAYEYEAEIVTEDLVNNKDCYNLINGGIWGGKKGLAVVKDSENNIFTMLFKYLSISLKASSSTLLL